MDKKKKNYDWEALQKAKRDHRKQGVAVAREPIGSASIDPSQRLGFLISCFGSFAVFLRVFVVFSPAFHLLVCIFYTPPAPHPGSSVLNSSSASL